MVIRLIDLGGDKDLPYLSVAPEANPFLGVRAIRLARQDPTLILTQLRAILRAGAQTGATPWIMAPMVADAGDVALLHELDRPRRRRRRRTIPPRGAGSWSRSRRR